MSTLCCSDVCEKRTECARHIMNNEGTYYVENFYTFGSGTMTTNGCTTYYWCGKLGNWGLFKPINKDILKEGTRVKVYGRKGVIDRVTEWHGKLAYIVYIDGQVDCEVLCPECLEVIDE